jgi:hypothetical protein
VTIRRWAKASRPNASAHPSFTQRDLHLLSATIWEIHPITGIEVLPGGAAAMTAAAPAPAPKVVHHRRKSKRRCTRSAGPSVPPVFACDDAPVSGLDPCFT